MIKQMFRQTDPMNRMQAIDQIQPATTADHFHDGPFVWRARAHRMRSRAERHGGPSGRKAKQPSERGQYPDRPTGNHYPPEEPVLPVGAPRLCPDMILFGLTRVDSPLPALRLPEILAVCDELRGALFKFLEPIEPSLAALTAERVNGKRPNASDIFFLPLASVDQPHADGRLLAMGLTPRKGISPKQFLRFSEAMQGILGKRVILGRLGTWRIEPFAAGSLPQTLQPESWTGQPQGATDWATVTPIVLDEQVSRSPALYDDAVHAIRRACRQERLPEPSVIIITPVSAHFGAPPADAFPNFHLQGTGKRLHRHAILIFPEPVGGPISLGEGRQNGYGLCRPMTETAIDR